MQPTAKMERFFRGIFLCVICFILMLQGFHPQQYKFGDQGSGPGVLLDMAHNKGVADRSNLILSLLKKTVVYHRPVLIVMKDTESEQITRWVNSLAFRFSDATWSDWTAVRTEYSLDKFETSYRIASGETQFSASGQGVLVASDDPLMIQTLRDQGEDFRGCLIEPNFVLTCD